MGTNGSLLLVDIEMERLKPDPGQPREEAHAREGLADLTRSIKMNGVVIPLLVQPDPEDDSTFFIKDGQRRWLAAKPLDKKTLPCMVYSGKQGAHFGALANLMRQELSAMEEAKAYRVLLDGGVFDTQRALAAAVGFHESRVSSRLDLLRLPTDLQEAVEQGRLPATTAEAAAKSEERQKEIREDLGAGRKPSAKPRAAQTPVARMNVPQGELGGAEGLTVGVYEDRCQVSFQIPGDPGDEGWDGLGFILAALESLTSDGFTDSVQRVRSQLGNG